MKINFKNLESCNQMEIESISEQEYKEIMKKCEKHIESLKTITESTCDKPEGGIYYVDQSFTEKTDKIPMRKNLMTLARKATTIIEVGFNMGHSSLFMLVANPQCSIECFDICRHLYTKHCFNYLDSQFPNRLKLHVGSSNAELCKYTGPLADMAHIDGSHDIAIANCDFFLCREKTKKGGIIVYDDTWISYLLQLWNGFVKDGMIKNIEINPCIDPQKQTGHSIGQLLTKQKCRIAVCTLVLGTEEYRRIVKYGHMTKVLYCQKNGYDLRNDEDVWDKERPYAWSKVKLILKCLYENKYDYVVWIDADTHIMDDTHCLEDFIVRLSAGKDILLASDNEKLNSGVIFVKNTDWCKKYFETVYKQTEFIHHNNWEQEAIIQLYEKNVSDCQAHIMLLHSSQQHEFNSYYFMYKYGHFLIHLAGCYRDDKNRNLHNAMNDHCPLRMETDTDESYNKRMEFLRQK